MVKHWKLKRSVSAPKSEFSPACQSLIQSLLEPFEHNCSQSSPIESLFQPLLGLIQPMNAHQPQVNGLYWQGSVKGIWGVEASPPPQKKKKNTQLPHPKKSYHYSIKVTISEKSSRRDEGSAHYNISQNAPDCISAHIHFKKLPGGMSPDPPRKLVAFGHSGLLPQRINTRQSPDWP